MHPHPRSSSADVARAPWSTSPTARLLCLALTALTAIVVLLLGAAPAGAAPDEDGALQEQVDALEILVAAQATEIADLQAAASSHAGRIGANRNAIADLKAVVTALDGDVDDLQTLFAGVTRGGDAFGRDTLQLSGMNLQIVDGSGSTSGAPNGTGNLIVGYNAPRSNTVASDRAGSHSVVVGEQHHWTRSSHLLAGHNNTATGESASVTGGAFNSAGGNNASVSGGNANRADGWRASVSGGEHNIAGGFWTSVSGGAGNTANGLRTSVLGGDGTTISATWSCHPSC